MKTAFIAGASRGIGKSVSKALLEDGYDIFLIARTAETLEATANEFIKEYPKQKIGFQPCDVSDENQVISAITNAHQLLGSFGVVFNNAGIYQLGSLELSSEEFEQMMKINFLGAASVARHSVSVMKKQKNGFRNDFW